MKEIIKKIIIIISMKYQNNIISIIEISKCQWNSKIEAKKKNRKKKK